MLKKIQTINPLNYKLSLTPNLKTFKFEGNVQIKLQIQKPTSKITLNSKDLTIKQAKLLEQSKPIKFKTDKESETLTLLLPKKLSLSNHTISIDFHGKLNDNLSGFYRSKYIHKGKTKYLATTQFEAPYARQAFPCFDSPDQKATFDVSLTIDKNLKAISNMPIKSENGTGKQTRLSNSKYKTKQQKNSPNSKKTINFHTTPLMSTYLLYFAVGDFDFLEDKYKKIKLRIVTTPGKAKQGKFAIELTKKFLKYFESYSEVPYPLPKLDLIAIPDFAAGAMENWGAITFREILLLFDKTKTSTRIKKRIAEVIAHELWHQWSGNLVTMKWWNDLWLNESFATYMASKAVSHYFPEWKMWEDFIDTETAGALEADSLKTTHSIAVKVKSPNEIEEIFDEISYGKGGSVLRMIESYIGEENFRKGVSHYLKKYKYKNASASDLWNSLSKFSEKPIKPIMESWINQPGYPLIEIKQKSHSLILKQKRFNSHSPQIWPIPLIIKNENKITKTLITKRKTKLKSDPHFSKANLEQEGFFRVKYSKEALSKLQILIKNKTLSPIDRWGIQNDLFNFCLFGEASLDNYLNFIKAYENEDSYFVLSDIYSNLYKIYYLFSQEPSWKEIWPKFSSHIKKPFQKNFQRLGWTPKKKENINDSLLRPLCIGYLSFAEDKKTISEGFKKLNKKNHPDIEGIIYSLIAQNGNKKTFKNLLKKYQETKNIEQKIKLLSSLYKFRDEKILKRALNLSLTDKVRTQNLRTVFAVINSNPFSRPILSDWIKSNWNKLSKFQKTHFVFMGLLETFITTYTGKEKAKEISSFLRSKKIKYKKTQANSFETMLINTSFIEKNRKILENYFNYKTEPQAQLSSSK